MNHPYPSTDLARHVRDCSDVLKLVHDILIKNQRNFESAVVLSCLDILHREFMAEDGFNHARSLSERPSHEDAERRTANRS